MSSGDICYLTLAYISITSDLAEDCFENRMAARIAGGVDPKIHVELVFSENGIGGDISTCSIAAGHTVFYHPKRFSRSSWSFRSIPVTRNQFELARQFCIQHKGQPFNTRGYRYGWLPLVGRFFRSSTKRYSRKKKWFCSEIVLAALYHAGVYTGRTLSVTPDRVYRMFEEHSIPDCCRDIKSFTVYV